MTKTKIEIANFSGESKYKILDNVLELLIANGNELATDYRWGSNPTGYFAILRNPIDFDLVRNNFDLPGSITLNEKFDEIDYGMGTVIIRTK